MTICSLSSCHLTYARAMRPKVEVVHRGVAYTYVLFGPESVSEIRKFHMVTDGSYTPVSTA